MKFILFAAGAAIVSAKCANDCSNHGDCNAKNQCECHRNYFGADCSQRLCPAGRAFIDSAIGDVNGDNSVGVDLVFAEGRAATPISEVFSYKYGAARDSFDVTSSWNEAHFYQECSSKGVCDTSTGQCACFPGYEGSGCARKSCENDCSGHGACKNYAGTSYNMWDADATMYCDCDAGYSGPGCELRVCPSGVDPVQASNLDTSRFYQIGFKTLTGIASDFDSDGLVDFDGDTFYTAPFGPVTWTITLTDEYGDEWTTALLTTNYDVVVDTGTAEPAWSLPIIAAGVEDPSADFIEDSDGSASKIDIANTWNTFGDGNLHVADQVKDALEALPNKASGSVTVHEIYTSPISGTAAVTLLSSTYPEPFTGYDNTYTLAWPGVCGRYDIYVDADAISADGGVIAASGSSIAGCGVGVVDTQLGTDTCADRQGNQDIEDYLGLTGAFDGASLTGLVSDADPYVIAGVGAAGNEMAVDLSGLTATAVNPATTADGEFWLFSDGGDPGDAVIYYQYPHFSNGDGPSARFPLFDDLVEDCVNSDDSDGLTSTEYYGSGATYHNDLLALTDGSIPGLSLFLSFDESTIETAPRVDYSFNNRAADAFLSAAIFNGNDAGIGLGETIEGTSGGSGNYASHSLVEVADKGGDRVWDVAYHGRQAYFLGDDTDTAEGVTNHMCSKRGLCDYSTGLCDCFSGFTGANCAEQNALAY